MAIGNRTWRLGGPPLIPRVCSDSGIAGLVSVVIPTFNRAYILHQAIDSVLAQTYPSLEIIVIDDGSTDSTRQLVASYGTRVRYFYQENAGLAAARNAGLAAASGEFIAFQDSDDVWLPWKLQVQVALMRRHPGLALVWTDMAAVDPDGNLLERAHLRTMYDVYRSLDVGRWLCRQGTVGEACDRCPDEVAAADYLMGNIFVPMFLGNLVHPPVALMRRSHIGRVGGLDLAFGWSCEDYEFFWRLSRVGSAALVTAPGMRYRVNAADQLTTPGLMIHVARGNLIAVQRKLSEHGAPVGLPSSLLRAHLAEAHGWRAEEELFSAEGSRWAAARSFVASLANRPRQGRRLMLLVVSLLVSRPMIERLRTVKQRFAAFAT